MILSNDTNVPGSFSTPLIPMDPLFKQMVNYISVSVDQTLWSRFFFTFLSMLKKKTHTTKGKPMKTKLFVQTFYRLLCQNTLFACKSPKLQGSEENKRTATPSRPFSVRRQQQNSSKFMENESYFLHVASSTAKVTVGERRKWCKWEKKARRDRWSVAAKMVLTIVPRRIRWWADYEWITMSCIN